MPSEHALIGGLLGIAVGDAIGLPYENLRPWRGRALLGEPDRHHFVFGRGMTSDDTEFACMTLQSWIAASGDVERFQADLAARFRWWLISIPLGGGFATYAASLRLCLGWNRSSAGISSAGNAPALRALMLGAAIDDVDTWKRFVAASTALTHTDPQAEWGSLTMALAAQMARETWPFSGGSFLDRLAALLPDEATAEFVPVIRKAIEAAEGGIATTNFAIEMQWENGISGYILHTVAIALHSALRHPGDYREAVMQVIRCGGDADSTAAVTGGLLGVGLGSDAIPGEWLEGIWEPQRTIPWMRDLAITAARAESSSPPELSFLPLLGRNALFAGVVFYHIFRRWLPPYW